MPAMIDAHQHYWRPERGDYDWMPKGDPVLDRPYGPADLDPALARHGITHTILVQAAATIHETEYMLGLADATPSVAGIVGWVDFENRDDLRHLERLKRHRKFLGVRPMIQDIDDVDWMLRGDVQWAFAALRDLDLTFDALGFPRHLNNFVRILTRYPDLRTVIDHCMKPEIRVQMAGGNAFGPWAAGMNLLARETGAFCKLSGLVTEAQPGWTLADIEPFAGYAMHCFKPERVMWGSDWPVCQLRATYDQWRETAILLCRDLMDEDKANIFGGTAKAFYRLDV